jgi:hypothetical protein
MVSAESTWQAPVIVVHKVVLRQVVGFSSKMDGSVNSERTSSLVQSA